MDKEAMENKRMKKDGQCAQILSSLKRGEGITPLSALRDFGCFRLSGRIWELKQKGWKIRTERVRDMIKGKTYARYTLDRSQRNGANIETDAEKAAEYFANITTDAPF